MQSISPMILITCALFLTACSITSPEMNKPQSTKSSGFEIRNDRSDELALLMTFSGGGTRSAALSYGVLEQLRDTPVIINNKKRRLLDEVDLISSVSGGSFTSAYFGLFGDRLFQDFEKKFLKRQVQTELVRLSLLSPRAWVRLAPSLFERSDLAAEYYNRLIFKKKTFGDLRKNAPFILINATDLSVGRGFAFSDYHFSWICSDLYSYPISRAVAASAAVPIVFSPITLQNHAAKCNYAPIIWNADGRNKNKEKRLEDALKITNYRDNKNIKYLHLVDGGVADNLGIRSILDIVTYHNNNMWNTMKTYNMQKTKKMVFITVNAASFQNPNIGNRRQAPSTVNIIDATTTIQSNQYNTETIDLLRSKFPIWKRQIQRGRCKDQPSPGCANVEFELIEINLEDLTENEIKQLGIVPTALELPAKTVDRLKSAGRNLIKRSEGFQRLIQQY